MSEHTLTAGTFYRGFRCCESYNDLMEGYDNSNVYMNGWYLIKTNEGLLTPQLHTAIGDWSVFFRSEPMTTYLTLISPTGHLFSTYQLLLGKDKLYRWKITDWDF